MFKFIVWVHENLLFQWAEARGCPLVDSCYGDSWCRGSINVPFVWLWRTCATRRLRQILYTTETIVPGTEDAVWAGTFPEHSKEVMQTLCQHLTVPAQNAAEISSAHCNCTLSQQWNNSLKSQWLLARGTLPRAVEFFKSDLIGEPSLNFFWTKFIASSPRCPTASSQRWGSSAQYSIWFLKYRGLDD